jgi:NADH:ubiquinone oxidoreductase subunit 6 (subunit J)
MFEAPTIATIAFWVISAVTLIAAAIVVTVSDVFKAAVALAMSFLGVAGLYFLLNAEFIGAVQILVYVGAISILLAFAVMFMRDVAKGSRPVARPALYSAGAAALFLFAVVALVAYNTEWTPITSVGNAGAASGLVGAYVETDAAGARELQAADPADEAATSGVLIDSSGPIGTLLVRDFVLPFEILGFLMVAALIGALAVMRTAVASEDAQEDPAG